MALLRETAYQYYEAKQTFVATANQTQFTLKVDPIPSSANEFNIEVNGVEVAATTYSYAPLTGVITFSAGKNVNDEITVILKDSGLGKYRFIRLDDIINNYMIAYVGDGKIINKTKRSEVLFHAQRGIQEFSYDVSRVEKIQEVEVGPSLSIPMPQDYVNYVSLSWVDDAGIERIIYPTRLTSKPSQAVLQDEDYKYLYDQNDDVLTGTPVTDARFKDYDISNISGARKGNESLHDLDDSLERLYISGKRYGLNPETSQENGVFIIDEANGKISFSSNIADKIIILKYISDGISGDGDVKIHKFIEEALYKHISYSIVNAKSNTPEYIVNRFRKERRAAMRNAKIRLSNLKLNELTQVMRGKSKIIK